MAKNLDLVLTNKYLQVVKRADGNGLNQIVIKYLMVSDKGGDALPTDDHLDGTTRKINVDSAKYQGESLISLTALDDDDSAEYSVRSIGVFTDKDEMIAVCKLPNAAGATKAIATKTKAADLYLSVDLLIKNGDPSKFNVRGVPWHPAVATHVSKGVLRIATRQEALEEKINDAAITPIVFKAVHDQIKSEVNAEVVKMQKLIDQFKGALCQAGHIQFWFSKAPIPPHWFDCNGSAFPAKYKELLKLYPNGKTPNFEGRYPRQGASQAGTFLKQEYQSHTHGGNVHTAKGYRIDTTPFDYGSKQTTPVTLNNKFSTFDDSIGGNMHSTANFLQQGGNGSNGYKGHGAQFKQVVVQPPGLHHHQVIVNFGAHTHNVYVGGHKHSVTIRDHGHGLTINASGGSETRPNSFVGRFIIFGGIPH